MSVSITIDATSPHFAAVLALLSGTAPAAIAANAPQPAPAPAPGAGTDDDESGDAPAAAGQTDKDGMPHLPSVHSDPPKLTAKGEWRKKRGVTEQEVAQAVMLWKSAQPAAAPQPVPTPSPVAMPQPAPAPVPVPQMPAAPVPPVAMPTPAPAPVPQMPTPAPAPVAVQPAAPAPAPNDFQSFMVHVTTKTSQIGPDNLPVITAEYLAQITQEIATAYNTPLSSITDIAAHPHMIEYAAQLMARDGRW